jgi:glutathione S-transferase
MILIGQLDSPFVRRVAVTLHTYGMPYDSEALSVFADYAALREVNPLGQVPALVLDDTETLFDSTAILDHLDAQADPAVRLVPEAGAERRRVLRGIAVGLGAAVKAVALSAERRRRERGTYDADWAARLEGQIAAAFSWLEAQSPDPWFTGSRLTQAGVTTACAMTYVAHRHPDLLERTPWPRLRQLSGDCEQLPAFRAAPFPAAP